MTTSRRNWSSLSAWTLLGRCSLACPLWSRPVTHTHKHRHTHTTQHTHNTHIHIQHIQHTHTHTHTHTQHTHTQHTHTMSQSIGLFFCLFYLLYFVQTGNFPHGNFQSLFPEESQLRQVLHYPALFSPKRWCNSHRILPGQCFFTAMGSLMCAN